MNELTPEEIGDNLDLEVDATYPRSDGSSISTISVDKLLQAQLANRSRPELREADIEVILYKYTETLSCGYMGIRCEENQSGDDNYTSLCKQILALCEEEIRLKLEAEFALKFNPDYLDYQRGVKTTKKIWKVKVKEATLKERERITTELEDIDEIASGHNDFVSRICKLIVELRRTLKQEGK